MKIYRKFTVIQRICSKQSNSFLNQLSLKDCKSLIISILKFSVFATSEKSDIQISMNIFFLRGKFVQSHRKSSQTYLLKSQSVPLHSFSPKHCTINKKTSKLAKFYSHRKYEKKCIRLACGGVRLKKVMSEQLISPEFSEL